MNMKRDDDLLKLAYQKYPVLYTYIYIEGIINTH